MAQQFYTNTTAPRNNRKPILIVAGVILAVVLIVGIITSLTKSGSIGDAFSTYSGAGVSVQYPKDYDKSTNDDIVRFSPKDSKLKSEITVTRSDSSLNSAEETTSALEGLKSTLITPAEKQAGLAPKVDSLNGIKVIEFTRVQTDSKQTKICGFGKYYLVCLNITVDNNDSTLANYSEKIRQSFAIK